nr:MAG TPA: hypothetical protein [Caudoviricetes sp.]
MRVNPLRHGFIACSAEFVSSWCLTRRELS